MTNIKGSKTRTYPLRVQAIVPGNSLAVLSVLLCRHCKGFLSALVLALTSSSVIASPFLTTSPKATALGNAVTADSLGASAGAFNPATLINVRTGKSGRLREYKLMALPFPSYTFNSIKPPADRDPYTNSDLFIGDRSGLELFLGDDPRDNPWNPDITGLSFYVPGIEKEYVVDDSLVKVIAVPFLSSVYRPSPDSRFVFSLSTIAMPAGAELRQEPWMIKPNRHSFGLFGLAPMVAYRINDQWSVGGSIGITTVGVKLGFTYRHPGTTPALVSSLLNEACLLGSSELLEICEPGVSFYNTNLPLFHTEIEANDKFSANFKLGLLWEPASWLSWGLSYEHQTRYTLKGPVKVTFPDELINLTRSLNQDFAIGGLGIVEAILGGELGREHNGEVAVNFTNPTNISTGIVLKLTPRFQLNLDYHWKAASAYNDVLFTTNNFNDQASGERLQALVATLLSGRFQITTPATIAFADPGIGIKVKDVGHFAYGVSYSYSDRLTLRAGYEHRASGLSQPSSIGVPLNSMRTRAFGISYLWDKDSTLDITYATIGASSFSRAGESFLNTVSPERFSSLFPGTDLEVSYKVHLLQVEYAKAF